MKKKSGGINVGTSLILVIFVLLALVSFAALSYLSAKSDYTLSVEAANRTASYYDANRMAELYMANIEGLLAKHEASVNSKDEYMDGIDRVFSDNDNIRVEKDEDRIRLNYTVAVTNGQNLEVSLIAHYPDDKDFSLFYVDKWATCTNNEWLEQVRDEGAAESGVKLLFK